MSPDLPAAEDPLVYDGLAIPATTAEVPSRERRDRMERAARAAAVVMSNQDATVSFSPLGAGWSSDLDIYARDRVAAMDTARSAGWISLDGVLEHIGYPGTGRWALLEGKSVLARADIQQGSAPDLGAALADRIARRGRIGLRETLELRYLAARTTRAPLENQDALAAAAAREVALGGDTLAGWLRPEESQPPQPRSAAVRSRITAAVRPRIRIALSGVDGAGKSSLVEALGEALANCGISSSVVWTRPGMRLSVLERLARVGKRALRMDRDGLADIASGTAPGLVRSRRGIVGWIWSVLVTVAYVWDVWRRSVAARGDVVIYDRHLLDAVATIEAFYEGVNTSLQTWLVRRLIPRADAAVFIDVPVAVAVSRKQDVLFNQLMLERQIARYQVNAANVEDLIRIDGSASQDGVFIAAFSAVTNLLGRRTSPTWARFVARIRQRR